MSCAEGDQGFVYDGAAAFEVIDLSLDEVPQTRTRIMLNLRQSRRGVSVVAATGRWRRPCAHGIRHQQPDQSASDGIGALDRVRDAKEQDRIAELTRGYDDRTDYFVDRLARGLARIAAAQYPRPVIVRMSDFKTNEYANLIGGAEFEPTEENPMIGFRGASRYYSPRLS